MKRGGRGKETARNAIPRRFFIGFPGRQQIVPGAVADAVKDVIGAAR